VAVSAISACALALSYTFWSQAVIAEVYTLHSLFVMLLLLIALKWKETREIINLYLFSFVYGLSMCNHLMLTLVLFPGFAFLLIMKEYKKPFWSSIDVNVIRLRAIGLMIFFLIIGLLPYLYLPIRSYQQPEISSIDFTKLSNVLNYVSGGHYIRLAFQISFNQVWEKITSFFYFLIMRELLFVGFVLIIFGMMLLNKKDKLLFISALILIITNFLVNIIYPINYKLEEVWPWFIAVFTMLNIFGGLGMVSVIQSFNKYPKKRIVTFLFLIIPLLLFITNYNNINKSNDYSAKQYAATILRYVKNNSIIITRYGGDDTDTLYYLKLIENQRKDVYIDSIMILIQKIMTSTNNYGPFISIERRNAMIFNFIKQNIIQYPIYFITKPPQQVMRAHNFSGAITRIKSEDLINQSKFIDKIMRT
jgi:hypothetical protein